MIDCYGRACHGTRRRGYGCKLKAGDVLGVLLNTADDSLSFFIKGMHLDDDSEDDLYTLVLLMSSTRSSALGREAQVVRLKHPLARCLSAFVLRPRSVACSVSWGFDGVLDGVSPWAMS